MTAQAKEKLGSYRYYTHDWGWPGMVSASDGLREVRHRIAAITAASTQICQVCGEPGTLHVSPLAWRATVCKEHAMRWLVDGEPLAEQYREHDPDTQA